MKTFFGKQYTDEQWNAMYSREGESKKTPRDAVEAFLNNPVGGMSHATRMFTNCELPVNHEVLFNLYKGVVTEPLSSEQKETRGSQDEKVMQAIEDWHHCCMHMACKQMFDENGDFQPWLKALYPIDALNTKSIALADGDVAKGELELKKAFLVAYSVEFGSGAISTNEEIKKAVQSLGVEIVIIGDEVQEQLGLKIQRFTHQYTEQFNNDRIGSIQAYMEHLHEKIAGSNSDVSGQYLDNRKQRKQIAQFNAQILILKNAAKSSPFKDLRARGDEVCNAITQKAEQGGTNYPELTNITRLATQVIKNPLESNYRAQLKRAVKRTGKDSGKRWVGAFIGFLGAAAVVAGIVALSVISAGVVPAAAVAVVSVKMGIASIVGGAAITAGGAGINRSGVKGQGLFKASRRLLEASKKSPGKQQDLTVSLLDEEHSCDGERKASINRVCA